MSRPLSSSGSRWTCVAVWWPPEVVSEAAGDNVKASVSAEPN